MFPIDPIRARSAGLEHHQHDARETLERSEDDQDHAGGGHQLRADAAPTADRGVGVPRRRVGTRRGRWRERLHHSRIATLRSASKAARTRTARRRARRTRSATRRAPASAATPGRRTARAPAATCPRPRSRRRAPPAPPGRDSSKIVVDASPSRPTTVKPTPCSRSSARGMLATRACGRCRSAPADARIAAGVTSAARRVRVTSIERARRLGRTRRRAEVLRIRRCRPGRRRARRRRTGTSRARAPPARSGVRASSRSRATTPW